MGCSLSGKGTLGTAAEHCKRSCAKCSLDESESKPSPIETDDNGLESQCVDSLEWMHKSVKDGDCAWVSEFLPRCNWQGNLGKAKDYCKKSCTHCGNDLLKASVISVAELQASKIQECLDDDGFNIVDSEGNRISNMGCTYVASNPRACNWQGNNHAGISTKASS